MAGPAQPGRPKWTILVVNRKVLIAAVLLVCVVLLITTNTFWRWMYPIGYQPIIQQAAKEYDVDPLLIVSVVRVESKFKSEDVSHAGAIGLMQLMPATAEWIVAQMQDDGIMTGYSGTGDAAELARPDVNIRLGTWYIRYLVTRFHGNEVAAIAAYNAGPQRVQDWLQSGQWDGQLRTIGSIPVGETRHFVDRVFYNYELYKRIYGNDPDWQNRT